MNLNLRDKDFQLFEHFYRGYQPMLYRDFHRFGLEEWLLGFELGSHVMGFRVMGFVGEGKKNV